MLHTAYYEAAVKDFCTAEPNAVLGELATRHGFALESQQKFLAVRWTHFTYCE